MKRLETTLLALLLGAIGWAQNGAAPKVLIPMIVTDSHNHPVKGVTADSLVISDHKTHVADFSLLGATDLPLDLGVVIDTSRSQRDTFLPDTLQIKDLVNHVIRTGDDRVFFLTFSDKPEASPWLKKEEITGVSVNMNIAGTTSLYDAIASACNQRMGSPDRRKPSRRVLIVISDGEDNSSHTTRESAESAALKSGVVIFGISTEDSPMTVSGRGNRNLGLIAAATGGKLFAGLRRPDVSKVFATINELMDDMYFASYVPPHPTDHNHDIDIRPSLKKKFEVSYPPKYAWFP